MAAGGRDQTGRRGKGFRQAGGLVSDRMRAAGAKRGFAEMRLLTHWADVVGPALAAIVQPVKVVHAQGGLGATLIVTATGARAPEVQMQLPQLRDRVNACYGYGAITRITLTQARAPASGFAQAQAPYDPPPAPPVPAEKLAALGLDNVKDDGLRLALESLSKHVLQRKLKSGAG